MSNISERAKKASENLKKDRIVRADHIFLSSVLHTDRTDDGSVGYMKVFTDYDLAKADGDGNEPMIIGS
ncbi:MAG: hypothetical protein ABXS91_11140, partial [Sulfurimonas sp.]